MGKIKGLAIKAKQKFDKTLDFLVKCLYNVDRKIKMQLKYSKKER